MTDQVSRLRALALVADGITTIASKLGPTLHAIAADVEAESLPMDAITAHNLETMVPSILEGCAVLVLRICAALELREGELPDDVRAAAARLERLRPRKN